MINLSVDVDTAKITRLKAKFARYGSYAQSEGLKAVNTHLNSSNVIDIYPPVSNSPFMWSSERQRRYVLMILGGEKYSRTYNLAFSGVFKVDEGSFWITYSNSWAPWKYVLHPTYQIIGHRMRGWKTINVYVVNKSRTLVPIFKRAAVDAWEKMDSFIYGGGAGL